MGIFSVLTSELTPRQCLTNIATNLNIIKMGLLTKLKCKISNKHNKSYSIRSCNGRGYSEQICHWCDSVEKHTCYLPHCPCCGMHCQSAYGLLGDGRCKCAECCLKRVFTINKWKLDRLDFINEIRIMRLMYGWKLVNKILMSQCSPVYEEIQKLLTLS